MNWLDIVIIAIAIIFTIIGLSGGFVKQILSAAALIGGIFTGLIFYDIAGGIFISNGLVENKPIANTGGFFILTFIGYGIIQIFAWAISKLIATLKLSRTNRMCGAILGFIIGITIVFLMTSFLSLFISDKNLPLRESKLVPRINATFEAVTYSLPKGLEADLKKSREHIREKGLEAAIKIRDSRLEVDRSKPDT